MKILTRYILKEFIVPLIYCMSGFLSIYVLFELFGSFSRLVEADLPFSAIVHYFCAYLAPHFKWLAPPALMLATLYTMWNFCRHSELIAMRASGIGFLVIVRPILFVSVIMACFVAWVGESYVPLRAQWAKSLRSEKFKSENVDVNLNLTYRDKENGRTWNVGGVSSFGVFKDVKVVVDRPGHATRLLSIVAKEARWLDNEWWFSDVAVQHYDVSGAEIASPTPELDGLKTRSFTNFTETPADIMAQNRSWLYNSVKDKFRYLSRHSNLTEERRREYVHDAWAGLLSPFACIIITLFAIPAGVASGRQSVFKGVLGAIGLFFAFYALTIICMVVAQTGYINPIVSAFIPYVVFGIAGGVLFYRQR